MIIGVTTLYFSKDELNNLPTIACQQVIIAYVPETQLSTEADIPGTQKTHSSDRSTINRTILAEV